MGVQIPFNPPLAKGEIFEYQRQAFGPPQLLIIERPCMNAMAQPVIATLQSSKPTTTDSTHPFFRLRPSGCRRTLSALGIRAHTRGGTP